MDTQTILWNAPEEPVTSFGIDVPRWIDQDIDPPTIAALIQGGCESGAYMRAVTYHEALATMNEHGDDVLDVLSEWTDEFEFDPRADSWAGFAVKLVSLAVELWASAVAEELAEAVAEAAEDEDEDA